MFMVCTFIFTVFIHERGFMWDEDGATGFYYPLLAKGPWAWPVVALIIVFTIICIIPMNAPFWTANAEEEADPDAPGCKLCCKLPKSEGWTVSPSIRPSVCPSVRPSVRCASNV